MLKMACFFALFDLDYSLLFVKMPCFYELGYAFDIGSSLKKSKNNSKQYYT